ncbi:putative signal peptide protein [Puccinia sorghi]|uniref:Putative signal peptide protein n=1 Tax=Puccinia sorghi TaxID=27349 RepID=A0A0L6USH8_9BASI|nr:putative signal peptide protein [Puccinia sorghi]
MSSCSVLFCSFFFWLVGWLRTDVSRIGSPTDRRTDAKKRNNRITLLSDHVHCPDQLPAHNPLHDEGQSASPYSNSGSTASLTNEGECNDQEPNSNCISLCVCVHSDACAIIYFWPTNSVKYRQMKSSHVTLVSLKRQKRYVTQTRKSRENIQETKTLSGYRRPFGNFWVWGMNHFKHKNMIVLWPQKLGTPWRRLYLSFELHTMINFQDRIVSGFFQNEELFLGQGRVEKKASRYIVLCDWNDVMLENNSEKNKTRLKEEKTRSTRNKIDKELGRKKAKSIPLKKIKIMKRRSLFGKMMFKGSTSNREEERKETNSNKEELKTSTMVRTEESLMRKVELAGDLLSGGFTRELVLALAWQVPSQKCSHRLDCRCIEFWLYQACMYDLKRMGGVLEVIGVFLSHMCTT